MTADYGCRTPDCPICDNAIGPAADAREEQAAATPDQIAARMSGWRNRAKETK